jgi:hypothetical protein
MKKGLLRIGSACGLAMLFFGNSSAHAFCTEFDVLDIGVNCVDEGHKRVTAYIAPILRPDIWRATWNGNYAQDNPFGDAKDDGKRHFESCRFATDGAKGGSANYIRSVYGLAIANLDPAAPDPFEAADNFGKLLHTVQDFYSHTNWINLLNITASTPLNSTHLFNRSLGEWPLLSPLGSVRYDDVADCHPDDIIVGQIPAGGLPAGWSVNQELTSETPFFTTDQGCVLPGLITGWNATGACPDVRGGDGIFDGYSHLSQGFLIPRTPRLTHGESKIAGQTDLISELSFSFADAGYQADRPCHDGYPTYICLQKDTPGRPDYGRAIQLAEYQTAHEWCRLLHLAKDSQYGYSASSILMTLWARPEDEPFGPHPISTACGTPRAVLAGKPGPIELEVTPTAAIISRGEVFPNSGRNLVFALYTGDFRRSLYSVPDPLAQVAGPVRAADLPAPITMCVKPGDIVVSTIWGWDDINLGSPLPFDPREFDKLEPPLRGVSTVLAGPGFAPGTHSESSADMAVDFAVRVNPTDVDADGLAICAEQFYDTDPNDSDSDDDALSDGAEITAGTDPNVPDTDGDGLTDGAEVNTYGTDPLKVDTDGDGIGDGTEVLQGTDPLDADSDDDGLSDGQEATLGTDPLDPDTDDDLLSDGFEVTYGLDPLDDDSDDDGLIDGQDVDWISAVIAALPASAIKSPAAGNRRAMLNLLADAESLLRKGNLHPALDKLGTLRVRIDGCGAVADKNDWIIDCSYQSEVRMLLDILIDNLTP